MNTYFRLSSELGDGYHSSIVGSRRAVMDAVHDWCVEFGKEGGGFSFTVETVEMTRNEFEALPDL